VTETAAGAAIGPLDIKRVMAALPHRYPMLLVDRVESLDPDKGIVAIKAVTMNEGFFQGHFPGRPIMPGVLIVEALAQAAGVLAVESLGLANSGKLVYFMAIEGAKFRQPVEPGVLLRLEVEFVQKRSSVCKFAGRALVEGKLAAEAQFTAMIADPPASCSANPRCGARRGMRRRAHYSAVADQPCRRRRYARHRQA
jgi:3-hydroxyacyl-[acyl-carrier-protein] dehydratase